MSPELLALLDKALRAGEAAAFEHYRKVGELLLEAKSQMSGGQWPGWIKRNFGNEMTVKQAQKYMELAAFHKFGFGVRP